MKTLFQEIKIRFKNKVQFIDLYIKSAIAGSLSKREYSTIKNIVFFIGYERSGHTLVASLLDAHPNIVIANEWGLHNYIRLGYKRNQLIYCLLRNSVNYHKRGNIWTGYNYRVPKSWQGRYNKLFVIGDKFAAYFTISIKEYPNLIATIERIFQIRPKFIHITRNPFDIITTSTVRTLKRQKRVDIPGERELLPFIYSFIQKAETVQNLIDKNQYEIYHLKYEDFIDNPKKYLNEIIKFIGLEATEDYLENCKTIIFKEPHQSRYTINWPQCLIGFLESQIKKFTYLMHYRY
jgi:hypothetical protein